MNLDAIDWEDKSVGSVVEQYAAYVCGNYVILNKSRKGGYIARSGLLPNGSIAISTSNATEAKHHAVKMVAMEVKRQLEELGL